MTAGNTPRRAASLAALLAERAAEAPEALLYTFVEEGQPDVSVSRGALDRRARALAAELAPFAGERALLLYPPGIEYVRG